MSDDLGTSCLRLERDGPLAWCTIDRPHARNALTPAMYYGLKRAVQLVNRDPDLGALVITGTGDVFAPGGDMGGRTEEGEDPVPEHVGNDVLPFLTVRDSLAPVISAVNGICQGGGLLIAMLSDIAVASERATFRAPELLRGLPDAYYASALPAHVGVAVARDLLLSARRIDADEALRIGLIARVVPHDELLDAAREAAHQVLRTAPMARMQMKRMLNERYGNVDTQTFSWALTHSPEPREGMQAFIEKRPPSWVPTGLDGGER
jgi:enoyl-CoA hydratase/carnithine racemase